MVTLSFKEFARYPSLYVLGAFPAWLKVLSHNFGAVLLKKPKNILDSVPLKVLACSRKFVPGSQILCIVTFVKSLF